MHKGWSSWNVKKKTWVIVFMASLCFGIELKIWTHAVKGRYKTKRNLLTRSKVFEILISSKICACQKLIHIIKWRTFTQRREKVSTIITITLMNREVTKLNHRTSIPSHSKRRSFESILQIKNIKNGKIEAWILYLFHTIDR